jgi:PAS domain-containing protein
MSYSLSFVFYFSIYSIFGGMLCARVVESNLMRKRSPSVRHIGQRAELEIHRTNEVLQQRTRELAQALVLMRATLESTTDAILVTDEKAEVTDFNESISIYGRFRERS